MNEVQDRKESFEERLLVELRAVVEERAAMPAGEGVERNRPYATVKLHGPGRRLAPRLAVGGAAVAAVAAAVLAVSSGTDDTSSAFAVESQGEGNVRVEISSLSDAEGLEKALDEAGIKADVNYLAAGMACKEPRFTPSARPQKRAVRVGIDDSPDGTTFTINRSAVGAGDTLLVTASPATGQMVGQQVGVQVAEGKVSPCEPVAAPELPPGAVTESRGGPEGPSLESGGGPEGPGLHQSLGEK